MKTGRATMHGAVTIINATATGQGAALATKAGVTATWEWTQEPFQFNNLQVDDRLARAAHHHAQQRFDLHQGATVETSSPVAAQRGLKTSSGAAAAMLAAAADAAGQSYPASDLVNDSVAISRSAEVTLTGAFDDQCAVVHGGCHLTNNGSSTIIAQVRVEPWVVAVWVPEQAIPKSKIQSIPTAAIRAEVAGAVEQLQNGDVAGAMTRNGAAYTRLYQDAGLPVTAKPAEAALAAGALGAGLSGTGPAVAALFAPDATPELPPVEGGAWLLTEAVQ